MRILHTADWHVGRTIRGRSRAEEHEAVLAEIVAIAAEHAVDLVLVAGDQFDTAAPSPEAERIVWRALLDLAATGARVVVVAGNHDNPSRLAAVAPLLAANGVVVGAGVVRPGDGGVVDVPTPSGERARVALLPFLSQRAVVRADELMRAAADQHAGHYDQRVRNVVAALCGGFGPDTVNLVVSHLFVSGGVVGGGERSAHTIFEYAVAATAFPATAHYVALGHLHRAQRIPAPAPVHYAGSPLQLDFGETADAKSVTLVDAAPGRPAEVRTVALTAGRRLRTLRGTLDQLEAQAGTTGDDYLRVVVVGDRRAGLGELVRGWFPEAVDVGVEMPERRADEAAPPRLGRSPAALFDEYLAERSAADERVSALFAALLEDATAGDGATA
ncbi:MAG: exonuclease subunit SbcD [Actinomycetota bacterium]|nr:exonuclease subunit SbcD [Actinomycetota bacterium]